MPYVGKSMDRKRNARIRAELVRLRGHVEFIDWDGRLVCGNCGKARPGEAWDSDCEGVRRG